MKFVFVSDIFRQQVEEDLGMKLNYKNYSIIHNVVDTELFKYKEKTIDHRRKILSIRPFASTIYANDLSVLAILELSKKDFFNKLEVCFYGDGELFEETIEPLRKFKNIKIYNRFLTQEEIATLHEEYGIFLVPTRFDTQGVSRDEAMSSGLVPVTNKVAAVPEFIDDSCAMIVEKDDYKGIANAIEYLYLNPNVFIEKSKNASIHSKKISGYENTINKEIELIKGLNKDLKLNNLDTSKSLINLKPKISVIMTAYNVEDYINVAIESIINQSIGFENIELIIVNDASSDKTTKIIEQYNNTYKQIVIINNEKRVGYPGKLRNKALEIANGEYIMVLDSDDIMDLNACNTMYNLISIYKSDYIIGKYSYLYDDTDKIVVAPIFNCKKYLRSYINFNLESLYNKENKLNKETLYVEDVIKHPGLHVIKFLVDYF
ncbi:MAG: glycosyltransferase [Clostridia bacterium]